MYLETSQALFLQEIGRCRGRNWLNGNQALLAEETSKIAQRAVMREIDLKQANYFHKGFLTNFNRSRSSHIFVFFLQNTIKDTKQVKPLTLMVSTKSAHLLPDNSLEAFNGLYCTWKPVKFRWKHFNHPIVFSKFE